MGVVLGDKSNITITTTTRKQRKDSRE